MEWCIEISGEEFVLQNLVEMEIVGDMKVFKHDSKILLWKPDFEKFVSRNDVLSLGDQIINSINGRVYVLYRMSNALKIQRVVKLRSDGKMDQYINLPKIPSTNKLFPPRVSLHNVVGSDSVEGMNSFKVVFNSFGSVKADRLFRLMRNGKPSFADMYKIVEILKSETGFPLYKWVSKNKIKDIERTACHPEAIGDASRHGVSNEDPPDVAMSIEEAHSIINHISQKYLESLK